MRACAIWKIGVAGKCAASAREYQGVFASHEFRFVAPTTAGVHHMTYACVQRAYMCRYVYARGASLHPLCLHKSRILVDIRPSDNQDA